MVWSLIRWNGRSWLGSASRGASLRLRFCPEQRGAVRAFSRDGNVTLGADVSAAAGPVGRDIQAGVTPKAAIYTYSLSKGLFAGASLEGAVVATEKGRNASYYGRPVSARAILTGKIPPPPGSASLRRAAGR